MSEDEIDALASEIVALFEIWNDRYDERRLDPIWDARMARSAALYDKLKSAGTDFMTAAHAAKEQEVGLIIRQAVVLSSKGNKE